MLLCDFEVRYCEMAYTLVPKGMEVYAIARFRGALWRDSVYFDS